MARPAKPADPSPPLSALPIGRFTFGALSLDDAAKFAGNLCREEIRRAIDRGEIRICHRGKRVLIPHGELVRWLESLWAAEHGASGR